MKLRYKNKWEKYINSFNLELDDKSMVILDKVNSHLSTDFINEINAKNTLFKYIPAGLTPFVQPLDVCINAPCKKSLKSKYILYCCNNSNDKVTKNKMIEWIIESWEDNNILNKELIYNSFRSAGIANSLNREEDNKFTAWKKMQQEKPFIEDDFNQNETNNPEQNEDEDEELFF